MSAERFQLSKTGQLQFSHPAGTHDDRLWAFALAIYASRFETPKYDPVAALNRKSQQPHAKHRLATANPKAGDHGTLPERETIQES